MAKIFRLLLIIFLIPMVLLVFVVIHELGHTILARLLGDPDSVFYLARIDENGTCLGCNIHDHTKLSVGGNMLVSITGLLATQLAALFLLIMSRLAAGESFLRNLLGRTALAFAFLDVPVQVIQGVLYNVDAHTWPTNVDLMDFMLLVSLQTGAGQATLKIFLVAVAVLYLLAFFYLYMLGRPSNMLPGR